MGGKQSVQLLSRASYLDIGSCCAVLSVLFVVAACLLPEGKSTLALNTNAAVVSVSQSHPLQQLQWQQAIAVSSMQAGSCAKHHKPTAGLHK